MAVLLTIVTLAPLSTACCETPAASRARMEPPTVESYPPLPDSIGVAGAFAGAIQDTWIIAGGASFPDKMPWENGTKVWTDAVWAFDTTSQQWRAAGKLPRPSAYGVSLSFDSSVLLIGGCDALAHHLEVYRLRLSGNEIVFDRWPDLPVPLAYSCGAILGRTVYLSGGTETPAATRASSRVLTLNLDSPDQGWSEIEPCADEPVMLATAAAVDGQLLVIGGASLTRDDNSSLPKRQYTSRVRRYRPGQGWTFGTPAPRPIAAAPSPAPVIGPATIWIVGGDDGAQVGQPPQEHRGFRSEILAYHAVTNAWWQAGQTPIRRVTTPAFAWRDRFVIPSGEVRPGVRSPQVDSLQAQPARGGLALLDYVTIGLYLLGMLVMGGLFSRRNRSTDDYFRGGGRIPWWAAGISIFATVLSSITFMAIPAQSFTVGWNLYLGNSYLILTPLIVMVYLPFFRRLNVTSAYEYLELRFDRRVRRLASLLFILFQLGRTAIVLYLPSLALATATSIDVRLCIAVMGLLVTIYSVLGGVEGVIWTDVVQGIVLLGGALVAVMLLALSVDGGVMTIAAEAREQGRLLGSLNWSLDLKAGTVWTILIGSVFANLFTYTASQDVVQRYLTTRDEIAAARSIWTGMALAPLAQALFFAIGTGLFVFYRHHPERLDPTRPLDGVFPQYLVDELPIGVSGLLVAGIFAAAQSTLSSSLNSIATAYVTDFHGLWFPAQSDLRRLRVAQAATIVVGLLGTAVAYAFTLVDVRSIWETFLAIIGLFGGTISALFISGIFDRRASTHGVLAGAIVGGGCVAWLKFATTVHFFLYPVAGVIIGVTVTAVISRLINHLMGTNVNERRSLTIDALRDSSATGQ